MKEEIDLLKKTFKDLNIPVDRIKSITLHWEKLFPERAFPRVHVEFTVPKDKDDAQ